MKFIIYGAIFFIVVLLVGATSAYIYLAPEAATSQPADDRTKRLLPSGELIGFVQDDVASWLGIPFAEAPVDQLRWRAPKAINPWPGQLQSLSFKPSCPQISQGQVTGDENCLFLNIWSPNIVADAPQKSPVMFWIHGGGNSVGDASTPIYHGDNLSREHNVVVVSIQYRLGPLGWFRHPALTDASSTLADQSGNFGTLDIIEALKWVNNNISQFGGDPTNITIFGESAGAFNVLTMLASPLAKGLFTKAISQSGGLNLSTVAEAENYVDAPDPGDPLSAREIVNRLLIEKKLASDRAAAVNLQSEMQPEALANLLRKLDPAELLGLYGGAFAGMLGNPDLIADGHVLPKGMSSTEIFSDRNNYHAVPIILGTNRDETKLFTAFGSRHVEKTLGFPSGFKNLEAYNRDNKYATLAWKIRAVDELAAAMSAAQSEPVYAYRFDVDDWRSLGFVELKDLFGAAHALEIPFVFNKFIKPMRLIFPDAMQPQFQSLATQMGGYWAQFAHTGEPSTGSSGESPLWSAWQAEESAAPGMMVFDTQSDRGVRMVSEQMTRADLKQAFLSDNTFETQTEYCSAYKNLFSGSGFDSTEYQNLGKQGC